MTLDYTCLALLANGVERHWFCSSGCPFFVFSVVGDWRHIITVFFALSPLIASSNDPSNIFFSTLGRAFMAENKNRFARFSTPNWLAFMNHLLASWTRWNFFFVTLIFWGRCIALLGLVFFLLVHLLTLPRNLLELGAPGLEYELVCSNTIGFFYLKKICWSAFHDPKKPLMILRPFPAKTGKVYKNCAYLLTLACVFLLPFHEVFRLSRKFTTNFRSANCWIFTNPENFDRSQTRKSSKIFFRKFTLNWLPSQSLAFYSAFGIPTHFPFRDLAPDKNCIRPSRIPAGLYSVYALIVVFWVGTATTHSVLLLQNSPKWGFIIFLGCLRFWN